MATRAEVFAAVESECDYQDVRWNPKTTTSGGLHPLPSWLTYMRHYLSIAEAQVSTQGEPDATASALETVRKITTLGIRAMEQHGAPKRHLPVDPAA
jgi:hypothetical protein